MKVGLSLSGWVLLALMPLWAGCGTLQSGNGTQTAAGAAQNHPATVPASEATTTISDEIQPGESLSIELKDLPGGTQVFPVTVREDGTFTLMLNEKFKAAGLRKGELEDAIYKAYVPKYFKRLTVTVKRDQLVFFVGGEVKRPDRYVYTPGLTVLKAISAAGDFTDFAKKTNVQITRSNGKIEKINAKKALAHPELDLPVHPGDSIKVDRRYY
jgi:protein involved in polysaccharide export with SLBB domain